MFGFPGVGGIHHVDRRLTLSFSLVTANGSKMIWLTTVRSWAS
jgi:hypothetical protein